MLGLAPHSVLSSQDRGAYVRQAGGWQQAADREQQEPDFVAQGCPGEYLILDDNYDITHGQQSAGCSVTVCYMAVGC